MTKLLRFRELDADLFRTFRRHTRWGEPSTDVAQAAIAGSLFGLSAYRDGAALGIIRVVGEGHLNAYLQDLIVHPDHRRQGVGQALVREACHRLAAGGNADALHVGLMAAKGMDAFYAACGFRARPNRDQGAGFQASLASLVTPQSEGH